MITTATTFSSETPACVFISVWVRVGACVCVCVSSETPASVFNCVHVGACVCVCDIGDHLLMCSKGSS